MGFFFKTALLVSFFCGQYHFWNNCCFHCLWIFFILLFSFLSGLMNESRSLVTSTINEITFQSNGRISSIKTSKGPKEDPKPTYDKRVSGSNVIDDAINNFLQLVIRDHFENWYCHITSDTEFISESRHIIQKMAMITSNRCKEVDWLSFLTRRIVDVVVNHIRLFRKAKASCDFQLPKNQEVDKNAAEILVSKFQEIEFKLSGQKMSWISVVKEEKTEKEYLKVIVDLILQQMGSREESICRPLQLLSSQIITGEMLIPLFNILSDPDYINQAIIWLCRQTQISSDSFLTVIRYSENLNELVAARSLLLREIAILRSHDFGETDILVKRRLSSLLFVKQVIENQIHEVSEGNCASSAFQKRYVCPSQSIYEIPLDTMLKNNVALSYLLDHMATVESQVYIFFLLNAEAWKAAAVEQLSLNRNKESSPSECMESNPASHIVISNLKESALRIFEQYFSDLTAPRIVVDGLILQRLKQSLSNEIPNESCFDEIISAVVSQIETTERYLPCFRKSVGYVRMLAELDLLKLRSRNEEDLSEDALSNFNFPVDVGTKPLKEEKAEHKQSSGSSDSLDDISLSASINQQGVVKDGLTSHAVYAVNVVKLVKNKEVDSWIIYRRYSDFYDFHVRLQERFKSLKELTFPEKRVFNNMGKLFLERRQYLLNEYINKLLKPDKLKLNPGLQETLFHFFDRGSYEYSKGSLSRKVDSLVNPIVTSVRTVSKAVRMESSDFAKSSMNEECYFDDKNYGFNIEVDDKIPLRILLELMDEVFDLHSRNQWLRKRLYYMLRDILRAMYGDVFNQKIVDYVQIATSPDQVAELIHFLRDALWPNGVSATTRVSRDDATKMRTRVAAKASLLSWFPDEVKHVIGSETAREGVFRLFELFQNPILNRRLVFVILELLVENLFPEINMEVLFKNIHDHK